MSIDHQHCSRDPYASECSLTSGGAPVATAINSPVVQTVYPQSSWSPDSGDASADTVATPTATPIATPFRSSPAIAYTAAASDTSAASNAPQVQTAAAQSATALHGGADGVSKGAVAGIAIAMFVVGAALAFVVAWFLFRRRRKTSRPAYADSATDYASQFNGKGQPYVQVSQTPSPLLAMAAASAVLPGRHDLSLADMSNASEFLAAILPPAANEPTVQAKVGALLNRIQHHVDTFYRDVQANITPTMMTDLARFGGDSLHTVEALENTSSSTVVIKNALAGYILSIVSSEAEDKATLFPAEIAGLRNEERMAVTPEHQAAYMLYKRLAVYLHAPPQTSVQSRQSDIREAGEHFSLTFFPWANPLHNDQDKDDDLVRIINDALDLSIWLYGEPYAYEYVWDGVGARGTVVAPGLARFTDSSGKTLGRPERILEPIVVAT